MNLNPWERVRRLVAGAEQMPERRRWVRQRVHAPAFASFDGVTGGMILDLSEQGLSMQTSAPVKSKRRVDLHLNLPEPVSNLETTGYIAWADAFGRAGVRFSELPEDAQNRLKQWLTANAARPSRKAPKFSMDAPGAMPSDAKDLDDEPLFLSLEPELSADMRDPDAGSSTVQYEFASLGSDLNAALRLIVERARALTRGTGAAVALSYKNRMICRANAGVTAPPLGSLLDVNSGFSGECVRSGRSLRCDDTESDPRVDAASCRRLGIRSIIAAPIQYERETIGIVEVFATEPVAFDEGDVAVIQRMAQTVVLAMSQAAELGVC